MVPEVDPDVRNEPLRLFGGAPGLPEESIDVRSEHGKRMIQ